MDWLLDLDRTLLLKINRDWAWSLGDAIFPLITDLHKTNLFRFAILPGILALIIWLRKKQGAFIIFFLLISLGIDDYLGGKVFKQLVGRLRPFDGGVDVIVRAPFGGLSFPSVHAMNITCAAVILGLNFPKGRWFFAAYAFLVCYSRSYVGVHYPLDWLGGAAFGATIGLIGYRLQKFAEANMFVRKVKDPYQ